MTGEQTERCYLYRFFDADGRLLYVGVARDLGSRFAAHRRRSAWWSDTARGATVVYPSRAAAELAEAIAILSEHPIHNTAGASQTTIATLHELAEEAGAGVTQLVAEIERLRELTGAQTIRLAKMQGNLDAAREAYRTMRAKYLAAETEGSLWARKYFDVVAPRSEPDAAVIAGTGDWGAL